MYTLEKFIKKQRIEKLENLEIRLHSLNHFLTIEEESSSIIELQKEIAVIKYNINRISEDLIISGKSPKTFKIPYFVSHPVYMINMGLVPEVPEQKIFETKAFTKKQAMNKMGIV